MSGQQLSTVPSDKSIQERFRLSRYPKVCDECLYLKKLGVFQDEDSFYIATGCNCGPDARLSQYYSERSEAQLDLTTLSWRSAADD